MPNRSPERTTNILNQKDLRALKQLENNVERWVKRAEECKCANCWRDAQRAYERYMEEYQRLMGTHEDHEELFLSQFALMRLDQKKQTRDGKGG